MNYLNIKKSVKSSEFVHQTLKEKCVTRSVLPSQTYVLLFPTTSHLITFCFNVFFCWQHRPKAAAGPLSGSGPRASPVLTVLPAWDSHCT